MTGTGVCRTPQHHLLIGGEAKVEIRVWDKWNDKKNSRNDRNGIGGRIVGMG